MKVYANGSVVDKDRVSEVFEPGFLFGWGVFEVLRAYGREVPHLDLHMERLNKSLQLLGIEAPDTDFGKEIESLIETNNVDDAYIRITVYKKRKGSGVLIYADKFGYYPPEMYEKGFRAVISPYSRNSHGIFSRVKSLSYLENRMSWYQAQKAGCDEAVVLSLEGFLAGGARSNLFFVKGGEAFTPSLQDGAFDGVTRKIVIKILAGMGVKLHQEKIAVEQLFSCDEAFLTSSLLEVMPLVECEGKALGKSCPGKLALEVGRKYKQIIQAQSNE